jgi:hypothetical protein
VELSWPMRLRIVASVGTGVILVGILGWRLVEPAEPLGPVYYGTITGSGGMFLSVLAFFAGLIGYFASWPHGREIGILAAPAGLGVLALRSGSMAELIRQNPGLEQREAVFAALGWEPPFWLSIVAMGFAGVLLGQRLLSKRAPGESQAEAKSSPGMYLSGAIALIGTVLAVQVFIRLFAQDVGVSDTQFGRVVGQPAVGQIAFGVVLSFGIAGFLAKRFLNVSYIWSGAATSLVTAFSVGVYVKPAMLEHSCRYWPGVFFVNPVLCVLPVQMVAFGVLGSIWGYWMAVRYSCWRKHA